MDISKIKLLHHFNQLQDIDIRFSDLMMTLSGDSGSDELYLASVLVNHKTVYSMHICLDLEEYTGKPLNELFPEMHEAQKEQFGKIVIPSLKIWREKLVESPVVGSPGEYKPLILDEQNRLYLYRYWDYEKRLADCINKRVSLEQKKMIREKLDYSLLKKGILNYFPKGVPGVTDWQKVAAVTALTSSFCVISGGPGTGKTHTVTNILALLLEQDRDLNISICAPTGKAAARLQDSIKNAKTELNCPLELLDLIPENASTIHRLMCVRYGSPHFEHNRENPLPADVLIVDEASMVSLALMTKLVQAASEKTRIILLGDKNQLASVEAGAVFGDICDASDINLFSDDFSSDYLAGTGEKIPEEYIGGSEISDFSIELKHSYRFENESGIGALSRSVNVGNSKDTLEILQDTEEQSVRHIKLPARELLEQMLFTVVEEAIEQIFEAGSVRHALVFLEKFRILCSHRTGVYGVEYINQMIETILKKKKKINSLQPFYKGRPVIILRNDHALKLYNGDVGMIWMNDNGEMRAFFPEPDDRFRDFSPARLPDHETVYAMTIHKSQGSEFDRILMILPDKESPVFTRELIYTGITRAKKQVVIWSDPAILKHAVEKKTKRRSGLGIQLQPVTSSR